MNALTAADEVIIPVQCEYLALEGLGHLAGTLERVRRSLNSALRLEGLVLTMYDARTTLAQQVVAEVRRHFPQTFDTVVPRSVRLSEAPSHGLPIVAYAPGTAGAVAYAELARELLARRVHGVSERTGETGEHGAGRPARRRKGGLGRGLGALIPGARPRRCRGRAARAAGRRRGRGERRERPLDASTST